MSKRFESNDYSRLVQAKTTKTAKPGGSHSKPVVDLTTRPHTNACAIEISVRRRNEDNEYGECDADLRPRTLVGNASISITGLRIRRLVTQIVSIGIKIAFRPM